MSTSPKRPLSAALTSFAGLAFVLALVLALTGPSAHLCRALEDDERVQRQRPRHPELRRLRRCGVRRQRQRRAVGARMGKKLGVHRTYWGAGSVASAVRTARADAANKRVPWMSFKPPHSWAQMANGKGDAWARNLATRMKSVRGPVWVAVAPRARGRRRHAGVEADAGAASRRSCAGPRPTSATRSS